MNCYPFQCLSKFCSSRPARSNSIFQRGRNLDCRGQSLGVVPPHSGRLTDRRAAPSLWKTLSSRFQVPFEKLMHPSDAIGTAHAVPRIGDDEHFEILVVSNQGVGEP